MAFIDENYNKKIQELGGWIDKPFLEELFSNKLKTEVTVQSYSIEAAVAEGENYLSTLYRTQVEYTLKDSPELFVRHIIIKGLPESQVTSERLQNSSTFEKECFFYTSVQPAMRRLIEDYFPPGTVSVAPGEYFTSREDTLVMEDLCHEGYRMKLRQDQFDYDHCLFTLQILARLHALSVKLFEEDPESIEGACSPLYLDSCRSYMRIFVEDGIRALTDEMENWPEYEDAAEMVGKLRKVTPFLWEKCQALEEATGRFRVFNHGDMWMNNVMFKYDDDGKINSVKLVDFQLSRYTSPAMDLHYFFESSTQPEVLKNHHFQLLRKYHESFTADLATMGLFVDYPLEILCEDMRDYAVYGLTVVSSISAVVLAPAGRGLGDDSGEFLGDAGDQHILTPVFRTKHYKDFAMSVFRFFDEVGYLEDAATRVQYIVDEILEKEKETNSDDEFESVEPRERVMSAHDKHILARLKSSVKGVFRRFMDM